ncbi:MAG: hypothetical protein PHP57_06375 [Sideroxydans sp.]|nr:hypothetical protein [Sideroxydans sp.]
MLKILALLAIFSMSATAQADPTISADSGKGIDQTKTKKQTLDKKQEASKSRSRAHRNTDEDSRATEASTNKADRQSWSRSRESGRSASIDININGALISEFVSHYEKREPSQADPLAVQYFATCKPIMNAQVDYPTLNGWFGARLSQPQADYSQIVGRKGAIHYSKAHMNPRGSGADGSDQLMTYFEMKPEATYISRYARCRIVAHFFLSEASNRAVEGEVQSEKEIRNRIQNVFDEMDQQEDMFTDMQQEARTLWASATCSPTLTIWGEFKGPEMQCGVFNYTSAGFEVDYRKTLSADAIDGRTYKIAVNGALNDSYTDENSQGNDYRKSVASRTADTRERATEARKQVSVGLGQSMEKSKQLGRSRKDGAGISITGGSK